MKRIVLFRGKRIDNGEWVEGCLLIEREVITYKQDSFGKSIESDRADKHSIFIGHPTSDGKIWCDVDPKTVGQFTELTDKNKQKIFEGDILFVDGIEGNPIVFFDKQISGFRIKTNLKHHDSTPITFGFEETEPNLEIYVIGNIHDNPELLKSTNQAK